MMARGAAPAPRLDDLAQRIHAALPQTQCTRCGYPDCASYALAIASGLAGINQCPPGGQEGVIRLAAITNQPALPLNPANGIEGPRSVAVIDEAWCIGCTLCLAPCPADAIIGGNKMMHTVIEAHCTGCALCIPACPVDCITLENVTGSQTGWQAWSLADARAALDRYTIHSKLFNKHGDQRPKTPINALKTAEIAVLEPLEGANGGTVADDKRAVIAAALARARAQRGL